MDELRDKHFRDVSVEGKYKKNIYALGWEVCVKEKNEFIEKQFLVSVPHLKGGNIVCTCVKDHIVGEKEQYKAIGLGGFDYKLFKKEEGGCTKQRLGVYPYFKHLVQLQPGDLVQQMSKMNEVIGMKNHIMMGGGGKEIVCPFKRKDLWKCIG